MDGGGLCGGPCAWAAETGPGGRGEPGYVQGGLWSSLLDLRAQWGSGEAMMVMVTVMVMTGTVESGVSMGRGDGKLAGSCFSSESWDIV